MRYAALRPQRVRHLVLASALPPDYQVDQRYNFYQRAPALLLPVFALTSARRAAPEIRAALPTFRARLRMVPQALRVIAAPVSPAHMKRRMELIRTVDFLDDVRHVHAPALAITGEPDLDRTVPVQLTRRYLECLPGTEHVVLDRTGHMGTVTRPARVRLDRRLVCLAHRRPAATRCALPGWWARWRRSRCTTFVDPRAGSKRCSTSRACPPAARRAPPSCSRIPHPQQGGTMHTKAVYRATKALSGIGCSVLRFNFRGVGTSEGAWDEGRGEREDFRAGLDYMAARYPGSELWAAGFSFGAWIALTEGALDNRVSVLLGIAPAISMYDFSALKASTKPKFIIHGERDELFPLKAMYAVLRPAAGTQGAGGNRRRRPSVRWQGLGGRRGRRGPPGRFQDPDELTGVGPVKPSGSGRKACHRRSFCDG